MDGQTVLEGFACEGDDFYVQLGSGTHTVEAAKVRAPFAAKAAVGDVLWGIADTLSQDGDRLLETGVDLEAELTDATPRCMVPADAPVLTYMRGDAVAATATLLVDCAGDDLTKVPAKLTWATDQSTWIIVDLVKVTGA